MIKHLVTYDLLTPQPQPKERHNQKKNNISYISRLYTKHKDQFFHSTVSTHSVHSHFHFLELKIVIIELLRVSYNIDKFTVNVYTCCSLTTQTTQETIGGMFVFMSVCGISFLCCFLFIYSFCGANRYSDHSSCSLHHRGSYGSSIFFSLLHKLCKKHTDTHTNTHHQSQNGCMP